MAFDIAKAVEHLDANAAAGSTGKCAKYVREALEAGGLDTSTRPISAKDYGTFLTVKSFKEVAVKDYVPVKGDVVVIQNYEGGDKNGHIAMYDGTQWVSDFKQKDMWGGPGYRKHEPSYKIYRP